MQKKCVFFVEMGENERKTRIQLREMNEEKGTSIELLKIDEEKRRIVSRAIIVRERTRGRTICRDRGLFGRLRRIGRGEIGARGSPSCSCKCGAAG